MKEFISKKILVYNPETGKHEPIDAIRGESAYEIAVRTGQTTLPEDEWIKQVQSGQIDGDFVKTVNSLHPDENGNVKVTVNGQTADENGNIAIDVGGKVQSVNGQFPDSETGNVEIEVGNPDVITTLTRDEFNALTTAQIRKMYEDGVRTILVENEMEEGEGTYTISWDGITDKPNAYPPTEHRHEYAENLLKNAEFKIATMGYNKSYNGTIYSANEWIGNGHGSLSISNGVKTLVAENGFTWMKQELWSDGRDIGKAYTLAVALPNGTHLVGSGTAPSVASNDEEVFIDLTAPDKRCWVMVMKVGNVMQVRIDASQIGASFSFLNVALYEGAYTAQNLPSFIPVDPRVEMMKLGIAPVNLLVNSDWRVKDNIINQRGQTIYSVNNSTSDTIDRWVAWFGGSGTVTLNDGWITIANTSTTEYASFSQFFASDKLDTTKKYTFAYKTSDGKIVIDNNPLVVGAKIYVQIAVKYGTTLSIKWAALYEGFYTEETLPVFEPTHPRVEMLKLGLPVQPENLLDNSDWRVKERIINQRGETAYSGIRKYTIDRWYIYKNSTTDGILTIENNGISVDGFLYQLLDINKIKENTVYTLAIKKTDETFFIYSSTFENSTGSTTFYFSGNYAAVRIASGSYLWAALYEGSYTAETLPPFVPRTYAVELAECQRYYLPIEYGPGAAGYIDHTGSTLYVSVPVPQKMRKMPTVDYDPAYGTLVIYIPSGKVFKDIKGIAATVNGANYVQVKITFNEAFTVSNVPCFLEAYDKNIKMQLNADIK